MRRMFAAAVLAVFAGAAAAQNEKVPAELQAERFTLQGSYPFTTVLRVLEKKTGNRLDDRRSRPSDPSLKLDLKEATFWQAVEAVVRQAGCGFSPYQDQGSLVLIDSPSGRAPAAHAGIFRIAATRTTAQRDLETGTHVAGLALEIAWEPRFRPFYLELEPLRLSFDGGKETKPLVVPSGGQVPVSGRNAVELDVRFPAPPRRSGTITALEGGLRVLGPVKMLDFRFEKPAPLTDADKPRVLEQEKVRVSLTGLRVRTDRWMADILIENPPGGPALESYQTWLNNNRIRLERQVGGKTVTVVPDATQEEPLDRETERRAHLRYHFTNRAALAKTNPEDWTLVYTTPGRIVHIRVPFALKDLPLP